MKPHATTRLFRQHDVAPEVTSSTIYRQLTRDWAQLHSFPSTEAKVRRWARTEPAMTGFTRPGDIVDAIDAGDNACKDALLLALIRLFQSGHQLAGTTLLQAMLPKLARIAMNAVPDSANPANVVEDSRVFTVGTFCEVAADYPVERRPERVAANLALDTLYRVTRQRQRTEPIPFDPHALNPKATGGYATDPHQPSDPIRGLVQQAVAREITPEPDPTDVITADADLLTVIAWGVQTHAITRAEGQMLVTAYLPDKSSGWGFADLCTQFGISLATARQRCSRAKRKLTSAVRAEIGSAHEFLPSSPIGAVRAAS